MATRQTLRAAPLLTLAFVLAGCGHALPPATTPIGALAVGPGEPSVVFARPLSPCDTGDYTTIVDEAGQFVGDVAPGTKLAFPVSPGPHTFFAWSNLDLRVEKVPNFNPVSATSVDVKSGPAYVALEVYRPGFNCQDYALVDLYPVGRDSHGASEGAPSWAEFEQTVASAQAVAVDRASRQMAIDSRPTYKQVNMELGRAKLERMMAREAADERHRALQAEREQ